MSRGAQTSLRAKGALISEPRFSTPCEMRFLPREKGKTAFAEGFSLKRPVFPFSRGKNRISQGVDNRGSLISAPLALREIAGRQVLSLNCLAVTPHRRGILKKREKCPLLWARDSFGVILGDNLGEGNCESKIVARQWGDNFFAARHQGVSQGPLGKDCRTELYYFRNICGNSCSVITEPICFWN